jgi:N-acyl-phosphatidylethanolamine-hydrolysing phospholipase D
MFVARRRWLHSCNAFDSLSITSSSSWQRGTNALQFQQTRSYLYVPLSWQDIRERFQRWVESTEHRAIEVQLLSRKRLEAEISKERFRKIPRDKAQWNAWFQRRKETINNISLPLPNPQEPRAETKLSAWKSRRKEQYQGWKARRKEEYQSWKARRKEEYQGWKSKQLSKTKKILVKEYTEPDWFDALGRPLTSRDSTGRFVNPWQSQSTNGIHSIGTIVNWQITRMKRQWQQIGLLKSLMPQVSWNSELPALPKLAPSLPPLDREDIMKTQLTWLGHATCWIQTNGLTILTDPMFSLRCGPHQSLPIGVPRDLAPSHSIEELIQHTDKQQVDICCITHDHYDHLDYDSVLELIGRVQVWVVPLGLKVWLIGCGVAPDSIVELEWWEQTHLLRNSQNGNMQAMKEGSEEVLDLWDDQSLLTITCCPASHWGSRSMGDRNTRLWCSFALATDNQRLFVCGDTGYPDFPLFRQIGDTLGPFDMSVIPIGAYEPVELNKDS